MRSILFFDLPAKTKPELREYRKFIKFIKSKGFLMMQESVYTKLSLNESVVESTIKEIKSNVPNDGLISILTITENQFASIQHIIGEITTDVINSEEKIIKL